MTNDAPIAIQLRPEHTRACGSLGDAMILSLLEAHSAASSEDGWHRWTLADVTSEMGEALGRRAAMCGLQRLLEAGLIEQRGNRYRGFSYRVATAEVSA